MECESLTAPIFFESGIYQKCHIHWLISLRLNTAMPAPSVGKVHSKDVNFQITNAMFF